MRRPTVTETFAGLGWVGATVIFIVGHLNHDFCVSVTATRSFTAFITIGATFTISSILSKRSTFPISIEVAYRLGFKQGQRSNPQGDSDKE
jgi:hypothetical protein